MIDRADEVTAVVDLLGHCDVRLLTLTGMGGVGKARVAVATAENLAGSDCFPGGVWLVDLATHQLGAAAACDRRNNRLAQSAR
jgi:hypothetical protein